MHINELIKQHGKALKKYAKNKYNYFLCTQALYFCLSGNKRKAIQALMNLIFIPLVNETPASVV